MIKKTIKILGIDPSGNFNEGKGITGIAIANVDIETHRVTKIKSWNISAKNFTSKDQYYNDILDTITTLEDDVEKYVVIENFTLHKHKALYQSGSEMETVKLIGFLQDKLKDFEIPYYMQLAGVVKPAMLNKHLEQDKLIVKINKSYYINTLLNQSPKILSKHELDAIRHINYFIWCNKDFKNLIAD